MNEKDFEMLLKYYDCMKYFDGYCPNDYDLDIQCNGDFMSIDCTNCWYSALYKFKQKLEEEKLNKVSQLNMDMREYSIEEINLVRWLLSIGCNYLYRNENGELCGHELFPRKENGLWVFSDCKSMDEFAKNVCVDLHGISNDTFKELQHENGNVLNLVSAFRLFTKENSG